MASCYLRDQIKVNQQAASSLISNSFLCFISVPRDSESKWPWPFFCRIWLSQLNRRTGPLKKRGTWGSRYPLLHAKFADLYPKTHPRVDCLRPRSTKPKGNYLKTFIGKTTGPNSFNSINPIVFYIMNQGPNPKLPFLHTSRTPVQLPTETLHGMLFRLLCHHLGMLHFRPIPSILSPESWGDSRSVERYTASICIQVYVNLHISKKYMCIHSTVVLMHM